MEQSGEGCRLCPRSCGVNRLYEAGYCGVGVKRGTGREAGAAGTLQWQDDMVIVARAALHAWEEPCISGEHGSGTVFFSGCGLRCCYCQNYEIALGRRGKQITLARLAEDCIRLQEQGANNINLVTPTHYVPQLAQMLSYLRQEEMLRIPVVYNTGGYERTETLGLLDGLVDVYLPDFKYIRAETAARYSNAPDYFAAASKALAEMVRQVGQPRFHESGGRDKYACEEGIMTRGVIVRHLVLPEHVEESKEIIRYLYETYGDTIYISIMNQYTPCVRGGLPDELRRRLTQEEYDEVVDYAVALGVENGFIQEGETADESFIPPFDEEGV